MRRVDRERRQDREDLVQEALAQLQAALRPLLVRHDADVLVGQLVAHLEVRPGVRGLELEHPVPDALQDLGGRQAVGRRPRMARRDLLLETRDPDLEELVQVAGEDGQEPGALQQRVSLVLGLVQHARVELQPRQLAVEVGQPAGHATGGAATRGCAGWSSRGRDSLSGQSA